MFFTESILGEIAVKCGLPQEIVRERNMLQEGEETFYGQKVVNFTVFTYILLYFILASVLSQVLVCVKLSSQCNLQ